MIQETQRRHLLSSEFISAAVSVDVDPTDTAATMAVLPPGVVPELMDWLPCTWSAADGSGSAYTATLTTDNVWTPPAAGIYRVLVRTEDAPEIPVIPVGVIHVWT